MTTVAHRQQEVGSWTRLRVQTVLYQTEPEAVLRAFEHLRIAVSKAREAGLLRYVEFAYGDCSPEPVFSPGNIEGMKKRAAEELEVTYTFFDENRGTSRGHNSLFEGCRADYLLVLNPDVLMAPDCLIELMRAFADPTVGMADARQLPLEHPKDYDPQTGDTSWASGACFLIRGPLFRELNGFDGDSFFLYCDDVDLSWRVRLKKKRVLFRPSAVAFHDKRLSANARWQSTEAERYYSAEAALFLAYKYSRPDIVSNISNYLANSGEAIHRRALDLFQERGRKGLLCAPLDPDHEVAQFISGEYAAHRYRL